MLWCGMAWHDMQSAICARIKVVGVSFPLANEFYQRLIIFFVFGPENENENENVNAKETA